MSDSSASMRTGLVYTFYSYKGGVGRSMALANIGVILAAQGLRVLLVDWDLEAPGLEAYFRNAARLSADPTEIKGVVDLLEAHVEQRKLSWRACLLNIQFGDYSLDMISAGRRTDDYRKRVQQLDWETLFREHRVGNLINDLRESWRAEYDAVLIDSRTGITDIGDICTVLLPDVLVLLFVTNHQNVDGIKNVAARAQRARSLLPIQREKLIAVPIPARDERDRESVKFAEWHAIFARELGPMFADWLPKDVSSSEALLRLFIPYVAAWSFGESLPVLESARERLDPSSLGAAYARIASLLASRLDWRTLDAKANVAEVASSRLEASVAKEAVRGIEQEKERLEVRLAQSVKQVEVLREAAGITKRARIFTSVWVLAFASLLLFVTWNLIISPYLNDKDFMREQQARHDEELRLAVARAQNSTRIAAISGRFGQMSYEEKTKAAEELALIFAAADASQRADIFDILMKNASDFPGETLGKFIPWGLTDKDGEVRLAALSYLKLRSTNTTVPMTQDVMDQVAPLLGDSDPRVRARAIDTLVAFGPQALEENRARLDELTSDPDAHVVAAARDAIRKLREPSASVAPRAKK